jgi:parallel beta-helix repeat protein/predicted outer membrane repeat protein
LESLESRCLLSTLTVLNLNDSGAGSLRQAILNSSGGDTINFAVSGTITLTSGPLQVFHDLTITGPPQVQGQGGVTISGNNASRVFQVGDVNFSLASLTVTAGASASSGAAMLVSADPSKTLTLTDCNFTNNHSTGGNAGGISITGDGTMNVDGCFFTNNTAPFNGGAIDSPGVFLNVSNSTFADNTSNNGGAISIGNDGVSVTNSTFLNNSAASNGGAIVSVFAANYTLTNCTLTGNTAGSTGGGISLIGGTYTLLNTIVAGDSAPTGPDVSGSIFSQGNNLIGKTDGSSGWVASDLTGTSATPLNPQLGVFNYYGGPTPTVPLLQGSQALGHGSNSGAPATDQRGMPRNGKDIGAVQLLDAVVTTTADSGPGSLRQAILDTNAHPGNDYITFDIPGSGVHTISLQSALPSVNDTVVIDGYSQPGSSENTLAAGDNAVIDVQIDGGGLLTDGLVLNGVSNSVVQGLSIIRFGDASLDVGGISIFGPGSGNVIRGNFLGVRANGVQAGADSVGVLVAGSNGNTIGGTNPGDRNILSGNFVAGFYLEGNNNTVAGNLVGLDATGLNLLGNSFGGVIDEGASGNVIGGASPAARNYISGNAVDGVQLNIDLFSNATSGPDATGNVLEGNWIGLNVNGAGAGGQTTAGVEVRGVSGNFIGVPGNGNVISGNGGVGILLQLSGANGNAIQGNLIGTDPTGNAAVRNGYGVVITSGAGGNLIGSPAGGNVISGNLADGLLLAPTAGPGNVFQANVIGLNAAGSAVLANQGNGIDLLGGTGTVIGGASPGQGNIISGNAADGIVDNSPGTLTILGNLIGTNAAGAAALGNQQNGIVQFGGTGTVIGNVISGNFGSGVQLRSFSVTGTVIQGNRIGTDPTGNTAVPNANGGVVIAISGGGNLVGGSAPGAGNLISGNLGDGVLLGSTAGSGNVIQGNLIGTNAAGTAALGNQGNGIDVLGGDATLIGGPSPGQGNVISGNAADGIFDNSPGSLTIQGNLIGTNAAGAALGNQQNGIELLDGAGTVIGGASPGQGNVISGNFAAGVLLVGGATGNVIQGNRIGTDPTGNTAVPNAAGGVGIGGSAGGNLIGGSAPGAGNLISGNGGIGVLLATSGSGNVIQGNLIGTNAAGTAALGNQLNGIEVFSGDGTVIGGASPGQGNVISGNVGDGVLDHSPGSLTIQGNLIGTNAAGTAAVGNGIHGVQIFSSGSVLIGGDSPGARNVISGNHDHGVALNGSGTTVVGNYIGTDATGMRAIGNGGSGIGLNAASDNMIGDTTAFGGNVISGNADSGIEFFDGSNGNLVVHNLIGTAADGVTPLGNGNQGIHFDHFTSDAVSIFDTIGLLAPNGGNVIAFNPVGIRMDGGNENTISGNSIFGNAGLGILLNQGANDLLAAPTLTAIGVSSASGFLKALPNESYRIEFFTSPAGGAPGQGKNFAGTVSVTTDSTGVASFNASLSALPPGLILTATATDTTDSATSGDTSQFSQFLAVPLPLAGFRVTPTVVNTTAGQFVNFTVTALDGNGVLLSTYQGTVAFASVGTDPAPTLPGQYSFTTADNGSHTFSVRYTAAGAQTLGVVDIINGAFGLTSVIVSPAAFDHLTINGLSQNTPVGVRNSVTVMAVDQFGNVVNFNDPLHFTSNDVIAQLPKDATLINGVGTFSVTFRGLTTPTVTFNGQLARVYFVKVTDNTDHTVTATQTVVLPLYLLPAPVQFLAVENKAFTHQVVATFLSDLANGPALSDRDFTATIDWGDGSPVAQGTVQLLADGSTFAVYGDHQYPTGQTDYPVDVTISFVPTGATSGFSSQPVTPSVAAVLTADQFAQVSDASVVRAIGTQTSLSASSSTADANLSGANAGLKTTLFVATYADNPVPGTDVQGVSYYDVRATNTMGGAMLTVTFHFTPGHGVSTLEYYDPSTGRYEPVVGSALRPAIVTDGGNTITITFDATSFPQLNSLQGSVFTIVISPVVAVTQTTSVTPAVSLALPTGSGLATTREVTFQASGLTIGLTPSEDVVRSAGRAELSGGGGDDQPTDEELDLMLRILGFGPTDAAPTATPVAAPAAPVGAPPANNARPAANTSTGPGVRLPAPAPGGIATDPADALFAAAAAQPFAFLPHTAHDPFSPYEPTEEKLVVGSPERSAGEPSLLAVPLLGAMAMYAPGQTREKKRRPTSVTSAR